MERKDDIGKFIEKRLSEASQAPSSSLWEKIDATLEKRKRRRRIIYLWSGIASLALLLLLLTGVFSSVTWESTTKSNSGDPSLVVKEETSEGREDDVSNTINSSEGSTFESVISASEATETSEENSLQNEVMNTENNSNERTTRPAVRSQQPTLTTTSSQKTTQSPIEKAQSASKEPTAITTINTAVTGISKTENSATTLPPRVQKGNKDAAAVTNTDPSVLVSPAQTPDPNSQSSGTVIGTDQGNRAPNKATGDPIDLGTAVSTTYYHYDSATQIQITTRDKRVIDSIITAKEQASLLAKTLEPVQPVTTGVQPISNTAAKKKLKLARLPKIKDTTKATVKTKFSISGHVVPVYFSPSQKESAIDRSLETNKKQGEWNLGFGAMANYQFNENAMISLGAYYTKLSYTTQSVLVETQEQKDTILKFLALRQTTEVNSSEINAFTANEATMDLVQETSYLEVPLQFSYVVPKNNFGFTMMGGFSTYFLLQDKLTLIDQNNNELFLGKAANLSSISLSLNAGVGFYYHISKKVAIDIQPVFKYRINALNQSSYNGETFTFGVQTGIRYHF